MTKVTFCAYDKPGNVGGPVTWLQQLLPALRDRGMECRCLFLLHYGEGGPAVDSLRANGIACETFQGQETEMRVRWILERLAVNPPDVFVPNFVVSALFAGARAKQAGIPTIGVLHSDDSFYRAIQDEFVFGDPQYRVSSIVCVSSQLAREVSGRRPQDVNIRHIPYGVVPPSRARPERGNAPIRIAYVGRLSEEQKQIGSVTRALCATVKALPGVRASIFGDGPDRKVVEAILAAENAGTAISLEGNLPAGVVQERLLEFDVIVLLSDYEGLPIALLEAMASGCIPISRGMRSGIPELVVDGVTGMLIDGSPGSLVEAVRKLQSEPHLRESLSRAARHHVEEGYSLAVSVDHWASAIDELKPSQRTPRIVIPRRLRLPPPNPAFGGGDIRGQTPPAYLRIVRRGRFIAGRFRRAVLSALYRDR